MQNLKVDIDKDGIALLTIDLQDKPMNVLTPEFIDRKSVV